MSAAPKPTRKALDLARANGSFIIIAAGDRDAFAAQAQSASELLTTRKRAMIKEHSERVKRMSDLASRLRDNAKPGDLEIADDLVALAWNPERGL